MTRLLLLWCRWRWGVKPGVVVRWGVHTAVVIRVRPRWFNRPDLWAAHVPGGHPWWIMDFEECEKWEVVK